MEIREWAVKHLDDIIEKPLAMRRHVLLTTDGAECVDEHCSFVFPERRAISKIDQLIFSRMLKTVWKCVQCVWICDATPTAVPFFLLRFIVTHGDMRGYDIDMASK